MEVSDQPFDAESLGDLEDVDLIPVQSGEGWVAQLDDNLSRPASQAGELFRFNCTCLMMLSRFVNDRRVNWHELLPFVMHAYHTSVHESTGYSPFWLMMGEECSLPQDVNTEELRTHRE